MKEKEVRIYKNYIFDLYGTLIDIQTDEAIPGLWRIMAGLYNRYGANYEPEELKLLFRKMEKEAREKQAELIGTEYPEIRIEEIFLRLLQEAPHRHDCEYTSSEADWASIITNAFRQISIRKFRIFPGAKEVLCNLRERGHHLYLLSNAQHVFTMPEMEALGLTDCFERILLSSDYGRCKPDMVFLQTLMDEERLVAEETVLVGDDPFNDMRVALAYGIDGLLVNTGHLTLRDIAKKLGQPETCITMVRTIQRVVPKGYIQDTDIRTA